MTFELRQLLLQEIPELEIKVGEPLKNHCSFRIGGPADVLLPKSEEELVSILGILKEEGVKPLILGNGTNMLFSDEGLGRPVIRLGSNFADMELLSENRIRARSGVTLASLACFARDHGLAGLEFAHGIPGSLGGAVFMNAGAYGGEMKQVVCGVSVLFPEEGIRYLSCEEMEFSYRHSLLMEHPDAVVLSATFHLAEGKQEEIREKMRELMARRKATQPLEYPSAGSTFKRPEGYFAGKLIDQCSLKGLTVGGAQVSEKHAGFVVNRGGATCCDVLRLMELVQEKILRDFGVQLEPEVRIIGREE